MSAAVTAPQAEDQEKQDTGQSNTKEERYVRTSDLYRTKNLPERFDKPDLIQGYNTKSEHPMYKTTGSLYGEVISNGLSSQAALYWKSQAPTVHTVPTEFHGRNQKFSKYWGKFGMYRNYSLNTDTNKV